MRSTERIGAPCKSIAEGEALIGRRRFGEIQRAAPFPHGALGGVSAAQRDPSRERSNNYLAELDT